MTFKTSTPSSSTLTVKLCDLAIRTTAAFSSSTARPRQKRRTWKTLCWNQCVVKGKSRFQFHPPSLLLNEGRMTRLKFKILIGLKPNAVCAINKQSDLAVMIHETFTMWDDACWWASFLSSLWIALYATSTIGQNHRLGRINFVICEDFFQVISMVLKKQRSDVIAASIEESHLWTHVHVWRLRQDIYAANANPIVDLRNRALADCLLAVREYQLEKLAMTVYIALTWWFASKHSTIYTCV